MGFRHHFPNLRRLYTEHFVEWTCKLHITLEQDVLTVGLSAGPPYKIIENNISGDHYQVFGSRQNLLFRMAFNELLMCPKALQACELLLV